MSDFNHLDDIGLPQEPDNEKKPENQVQQEFQESNQSQEAEEPLNFQNNQEQSQEPEDHQTQSSQQVWGQDIGVGGNGDYRGQYTSAGDPRSWNPPNQNSGQPQGRPENYWDGSAGRYNPYNPSSYRNPYGAASQSRSSENRGGWQESNVLNANEPYKWNFEEYDNAKNRQKSGQKKGLRIVLTLACCAASLGVLCLAGVGAWYMLGGNIAEPPAQSQILSSSEADIPPNTDPSSPGLTLTDRPVSSSSTAVAGEPMSTPDIAEKVRPSVVGILNYENGSNIQSIIVPGEGSGIIMSEDGYILTNAHVVENSSGLKVVLENGDEYEARIVGADDDTDIAVIKINAANLKFAEFGNSDQLRVGEKVVAIGNPRGLTLAGSVTQGIVSAVNRSLSSTAPDFTYIQTDAAINPGNSGGALVNEYGQVIGINTAKISQVASTVYEGIGFAIPITEAKPIIDDLKAYGRVTGRVKFGITVQTVDAYTASMYQIPQGAMIISTEEGSDISEKGVVAGDIIYAVDGTTVTSSMELKNAVYGRKPGDSVTLSIYRRTTGYSDKKFDVTVTLMEDTGEQTVNGDE